MTGYLLMCDRSHAPRGCDHSPLGACLWATGHHNRKENPKMNILAIVLISHSLILAGCITGLYVLKMELERDRVRGRHARR